jgi:hypothetical protein
LTAGLLTTIYAGRWWAFPVKRAGIGLPLPNTTAESNNHNSETMVSFLLQVMKGEKPFNLYDHHLTVKEVRHLISSDNDDNHRQLLDG